MSSDSRVVLCRHGVTDFTLTGVWDGRGGANPPLNDQGRAQAEDLAERVWSFLGDTPVRIISSSLARAQQTAAIIAARYGVEAETDPAWDELAFGEWDGRLGTDLRAEFPDEILRFWSDETYRPPGGESHIELHARVRMAFDRLLDEGGTTVVVAHWGPIMSCLQAILGIDLLPARRINFAATSMTSFVTSWQGPLVEFVNDIGVRRTVH